MRRRARSAGGAMPPELPDAIELIVIGLRAGLPPLSAIALTAECADEPVAGACRAVIHRCQRGERLADALAALPEGLGPGAAGVSDALATVLRYGQPLGPVLDRLAADARAERRRMAEQRARSLPVLLSFPLVGCTLPAFVLLAIVPALLGALTSLRTALPSP